MKMTGIIALFLTTTAFAQSTYVQCRDRGYSDDTCYGQRRGYLDCRDRGYSHGSCNGQGREYIHCRDSGYSHKTCYGADGYSRRDRSDRGNYDSYNYQQGPSYPSYPVPNPLFSPTPSIGVRPGIP